MAGTGNTTKNLTKLANQFAEYLKHSTKFDCALKSGHITSIQPGEVHYEVKIQNEHANFAGQMHGAFAALIVDNLTGAAIATVGRTLKPDNPLYSGVSVSLNMNYLRPGIFGETIVAKATVLKMGKTMAFTFCEISNKSNGKLIATGQHTKFLG